MRVARWGDVIEAHPGDVLVREDHTDYWFFVVLAGSVHVTRKDQTVATLHRGGHFGEIAIVGFRPQPATVTAVEPSVLFLLGRRHLLTLAATDASIQRVLFPEAEAIGYSAFVRKLQAEGRLDWERLRPRYLSGRSFGAKSVPGRGMSWRDALEVLSHQDAGSRARAPVRPQLAASRRRSTVVPMAAVFVVLAVLAAFYHPPDAVIEPGRPIDVVEDISITGAHVYKPTGHYLLTPVKVSRPSLSGLFIARVLGRLVVPTSTPDVRPLDADATNRSAHAAFLNSHHQAIALAEKTLHVHAGGVTIAIRDRGLVGPSAGLVYALAIVDMLGGGDLSAHRVVAATGELLPDGSIGPVGFVSLKARAAHAGGAVIFLVPQRQALEARGDDIAVVGVTTLRDAVRALGRRRA
jgi:PDZ domain-containing protein